MKIAILGTRGIPNFYGGFEQFAQYLSSALVKKGHDVFVYNTHMHLLCVAIDANQWSCFVYNIHIRFFLVR